MWPLLEWLDHHHRGKRGVENQLAVLPSQDITPPFPKHDPSDRWDLEGVRSIPCRPCDPRQWGGGDYSRGKDHKRAMTEKD